GGGRGGGGGGGSRKKGGGAVDVEDVRAGVRKAPDLLQLGGSAAVNERGDAVRRRDRAGIGALQNGNAQFAERYTVTRGKQLGPGECGKARDATYGSRLACDDGQSESDNFVAVFAPAKGEPWSGQFAHHLAKVAKQEADSDMPPPRGQNRSSNILQAAHAAASKHLTQQKNRLEASGGASAVVLSLVSRPGEAHSLHEYVYGGRWALFRNDGSGYKCVHISPAMTQPGANERNSAAPLSERNSATPLQLHASSTRLTRSLPPCVEEREIRENDVIIAGSHGFFDNLILPRQPPGAGKPPPDEQLATCLEEHVQGVVKKCQDQCAVCAAMRTGGGGGRASVLCIGECLQRVVSARMRGGGTPGDVTIFVTRAKERELSAEDTDSKGTLLELMSRQDVLRAAVVDPGGYRTFATCHVREV
ncbi:hypothetical protein T484DRAFT_1826322, partial [Baffinella frigidus]